MPLRYQYSALLMCGLPESIHTTPRKVIGNSLGRGGGGLKAKLSEEKLV